MIFNVENKNILKINEIFSNCIICLQQTKTFKKTLNSLKT